MKLSRSSIRLIGTGILAIAAASAAPSALLADTTFGVRTGIYTDVSAGFLGGEVLTPIAPNWSANPNVEVALAGDRDVVTLNGDFHYDFFQHRPYWVWAGAGPALIHRQRPAEPNTNDFGVNFIGGMGWRTKGKVTPYVQGKVTLSNDDEAVLAIGMRF